MKTVADIAQDPDVFLAIDDLELVGKGIADSVWYGMHRSSVRGPGVEFETHRDYQPGDDLRRVNWGLYARQRRLFTKESRRETQRPVHLLLDGTGSMNVTHGLWSKIDYARRVIAALSFLGVKQGDSPSLAILRDTVETFVPPKSGNRHALEICATLLQFESGGEGNMKQALADCHVHTGGRRGFVVFVSDFFDQEADIFAELASFRAQGHDVLALQVLDPYEAELPTAGDYEFVDAETGAHFKTSSEPIHRSHAEAVAAWRSDLKHSALARDIRWESVTTNDSLAEAARRWMSVS